MPHDHIYKAIEQSKHNRISFAQYMELALYHPQYGYYMREKEKIGRDGDFITSSNVSNVFGKLFANIFIRIVETGMLQPAVCEMGAGNGNFARAVLEEWEKRSPNTFEKLTYITIESSPFHRKTQWETLENLKEKIVQFETMTQFYEHFSPFSGIVFSNELFDAFPVHVVEKANEKLFEIFVTIKDGEFAEIAMPLDNEEIIDYLRERQIALRNGQRFEIPLQMKRFILETEEKFKNTVMFTIDYGYTDQEWQLPAHRKGSLRGYLRHQLITNPLAHSGEMDLTTHIQWDAVRLFGKQAGWEEIMLARQDHFLLNAGILSYLEEHYDPNPFSSQSRQNRAIRSLIMDGGMSSAFHVLIQKKNVKLDWNAIIDRTHIVS